jgi:hypothetical protein
VAIQLEANPSDYLLREQTSKLSYLAKDLTLLDARTPG